MSSTESTLDTLWQEVFPHRNPHQWSDESLILFRLILRENQKLKIRLRALEKQAMNESP